MVSIGMGRGLSQRYTAQGRGLGPAWKFQEGVSSNHDPGSGARTHAIRRPGMRFYNQSHRFYCGIDLHARCVYLCVLDQAGNIVLHKDLPAEPAAFLEAVAPYRDSLVVACECLFCRYWLADLCRSEHILARFWQVLRVIGLVRFPCCVSPAQLTNNMPSLVSVAKCG